MLCVTDQCILEGQEADVSILTKHSHKTTKSGAPTLLVESGAMSEGLAEAEWVASWLGLAKDLNYDLRKRATLNREIRVTSIMTENDDLYINSVTDAKSLYVNLCREQFSATERRAALEIAVIRDRLESLGGRAR